MNKPTTRPLDVLIAIREFWRKHGYSPSTRDLCRETGIPSTGQMNSYIYVLKKNGYIRVDKGISRSIVLIGDAVKRFQDERSSLVWKQNEVEKKTRAGRLGKGVSTNFPLKKSKAEALERRIQMVVDMANAHEGKNVMLDRLSLFKQGRVRSVKVG